MKECYIVVHRNYAEGIEAYAFYNEADAQKCVEEDVKTELANLAQSGYDAEVVRNSGECDVAITALDGNIYYEWSIIPSDIR